MPPKRRHTLGLIILPALFFLESCVLKDRAQQESNPTLLWVGDRSFRKSDLDRFFDSRLNEFRDAAAGDEAKSALLDSFIEEKLLLRRTAELGIEPDAQTLEGMRSKLAANGGGNPDDLKRDKELEQNILENLKIQAYMYGHLYKNLDVTQQECEVYYKEHIQDFVSNDVVRVREILVDTSEQAQKIQNLLKANRYRNFKELARQYSKAPTAADGGDLGSFQRGELPEELEKAIFPLFPGTISKIVRTQYGYHTFYLEDKTPAHQQKFSEVEDRIHERLMLVRQREALAKELETLAGQVKIQLDSGKLDFKYVGTRAASRGGASK